MSGWIRRLEGERGGGLYVVCRVEHRAQDEYGYEDKNKRGEGPNVKPGKSVNPASRLTVEC